MTEPMPTPEHRAFLPIVEKVEIEPPEPEPIPTATSTPDPTASTTPEPPPEPEPSTTPSPSQRVAIDPITRIEGHLRIEVQIDNGRVVDAWSAGMMFRGIELIMPGRDPRDAWVYTQRICGV